MYYTVTIRLPDGNTIVLQTNVPIPAGAFEVVACQLTPPSEV